MVRYTFDVSAEDDSPAKLRFAWYNTLDEAVMQAEHDLQFGVRPVNVEDDDGTVLWEP